MSRSLLSGAVAGRRAAIVASACALGVAAASAITPAAASPAPSTSSSACTLATLRGTYLYAGNGSSLSGTTMTPIAFAGSEVYTGTGQVSGSSTYSSGGNIKPRSAYTGTYTVGADCFGTLTVSTTLKFDLYVAPSGNTFTYIETDAGSVSAVTESRVAPK